MSTQKVGESCGRQGCLTAKDTKEHKGKIEARRHPEMLAGPASPGRVFSARIFLRVPLCPLWLRVFDQLVQHLLCLLMQVGRRAVCYACSFARAVEHKHCGNSGDITEGLGRRRVSDGSV